MTESSWPRNLRDPFTTKLVVGLAIIASVVLTPVLAIAMGIALMLGWQVVLAYGAIAGSAVLWARWCARHRPSTKLAYLSDRLLDYVPLLLALLSNALLYWMWCRIAHAVRPGQGVRFMNEAMIGFGLTGAGLIAGLPIVILRYRHTRSLAAFLVCCALLVTPFFVAGGLQAIVVRELDLFEKP